jgi:hypothetical protein
LNEEAVMSTRSVWLTAALALVPAMPAGAQIRERVNEAKQRPRVETGVVVSVPGRPDVGGRVEQQGQNRGNDRGEQRGQNRGNDRGEQRGQNRGNDRGERRDRVQDRYDDWRTECRYDDGRRGRGDHAWYDRDGRWDCGSSYREDRYPARYGAGNAMVRAHAELERRLDLEHERWHRSHGWRPGNRGWERSHAALHARLDREHERWHRRFGAPYVFWFDHPEIRVRAGIGVGIVLR